MTDQSNQRVVRGSPSDIPPQPPQRHRRPTAVIPEPPMVPPDHFAAYVSCTNCGYLGWGTFTKGKFVGAHDGKGCPQCGYSGRLAPCDPAAGDKQLHDLVSQFLRSIQSRDQHVPLVADTMKFLFKLLLLTTDNVYGTNYVDDMAAQQVETGINPPATVTTLLNQVQEIRNRFERDNPPRSDGIFSGIRPDSMLDDFTRTVARDRVDRAMHRSRHNIHNPIPGLIDAAPATNNQALPDPLPAGMDVTAPTARRDPGNQLPPTAREVGIVRDLLRPTTDPQQQDMADALTAALATIQRNNDVQDTAATEPAETNS